jgi:hypothetical protein
MQFPFDNFCTTIGALTATGAEAVADTTQVIHYSIDGKGYRKVASADITTPTTDAVTGAALTLTGTTTTGQSAYVVWCLDTSGNFKCLFGDKVATDGGGNFISGVKPPVPSVPGTLAPFALMLVKYAGHASTFTFGTSNWNLNSAVTLTINDMIGFIKRPN